eukprot:scaffold160619_cov33-Tisochrysis_lutea.AAC.2
MAGVLPGVVMLGVEARGARHAGKLKRWVRGDGAGGGRKGPAGQIWRQLALSTTQRDAFWPEKRERRSGLRGLRGQNINMDM